MVKWYGQHIRHLTKRYIHHMQSFIGFHYIYIVSMSILGSVVIYPYKNMSYVDALFMSVSSATNTGLNTIDVNSFPTYQQIFVLVVSILTHSLLVNTFMVVIRLYFFTKRFEDINKTSQIQARLRLTATKTAALRRQSLQDPTNEPNDAGTSQNENKETPSSSSSDESAHMRRNNPQEMMRSFGMLHDQSHSDLDGDDGPELVVRSPRDIEADEARGLFSLAYTEKETEEDPPPHALTFEEPKGALQRRGTMSSQRSKGNTNDSVGLHPLRPTISRARRAPTKLARTKTMTTNYLSWTPTIGKNSTFVNMSEEQRSELFGVEFRALKLLLYIIAFYWLGAYVLSFTFMVPWAYARSTYRDIYYSEGYKPGWYGVFHGISGFNNFGLDLSPSSMAMYQQSAYMPVITGFFILIGDIALPIALRLVIWLSFKLTPTYSQIHESLGFLLDHPRRCFLLLFPKNTTIYLFLVILGLNVLESSLFIILDHNTKAFADLPPHYKFMCGLFEAMCTRTVGFSILDVSKIHPAVRLTYIVMMYLSVFPVAISMRRTNVYEEQTLGVYYEQDEYGNAVEGKESEMLFGHFQRQISHDLWYISLGLFILCIAEAGSIEHQEVPFFDLLFECVSAYGNIGLSVGSTGMTTSLSGRLNTISKIVLMALMVRGRHRGLPYRIDRAILINDSLDKRDMIQQSRTTQLQQLGKNDVDPNERWIHRAGRNASRLRRATTMKLRPAITRISIPRRDRDRSLDLSKSRANTVGP